ncbi:MAG: exonuclease domain-containing protein [Clostridiales bacterium]|nr:exonuclease domain-containing protein [Clostridiales bacterium]
MDYIIMDLEWNTAYLDSAKMHVNEIIEVGAVKLNNELEITDSFSSFVKPQASRKIRKRIKELTHIEPEDLMSAERFRFVMKNFMDWAGDDFILLSWGDTDIRTLITNFKYFDKSKNINFIEKYIDLQSYVQKFIETKKGQQAGLAYAAECLGIDHEKYPHHRALQDSMLSADCLRKTYDPELLGKYTKICNKDFYEKLSFKPYYIKDIDNPLIDRTIFECRCGKCGNKPQTVKDFKQINNSFRAVFYCENCKSFFKVSVRVRKLYDKVTFKKSYMDIEKYPEENEGTKKTS